VRQLDLQAGEPIVLANRAMLVVNEELVVKALDRGLNKLAMTTRPSERACSPNPGEIAPSPRAGFVMGKEAILPQVPHAKREELYLQCLLRPHSGDCLSHHSSQTIEIINQSAINAA